MVEKIQPLTRSRMMAGIRGKDTQPEKVVRSFLHKQGFRFRLHKSGLPGRPDVVLARWKVVVFVHGCFWHGHENCHYFKVPKTRSQFWSDKIQANRNRDEVNCEKLINAGWRVAILWECALRDKPEEALTYLRKFVESDLNSVDIRSCGKGTHLIA